MTAVVERFTIQNHYTGIINQGTLIVDKSAIRDGLRGIWNKGALTLNNSTVSGNSASWGAGIYHEGSALTVNSSAITGNRAEQNGGGILNEYRQITLNNSTVSNNTAGDYGGGIQSVGGAAVLYLNNSTVSANTASYGGGIYNWEGTVVLQNSILGANTGASGPDCAGAAFGSTGYNLIGSTSGCTFSASTGDLTGVDPRLGLTVGSPGYVPLLPGSPAIDAGDPAGCIGSTGPLYEDQRGLPRVGRCDIGTYEYAVSGPPATIGAFSGAPQTSPPTIAFRLPLQTVVLDGAGSPVAGATVQFSAPAGGASGTFADSGTAATTAVTAESGIATSATWRANGVTGAYTVAAQVAGVASPAGFPLTNRGWFVAPGGSDANECQQPAAPCATINAAPGKLGFVAGDTVLVATGIYTGSGEQVVLVDKSATLSGGWNPGFTAQTGSSTIDGQHARMGLKVSFGVTAVVERFTIRNGNGPGIYNDCGTPGHLTLLDSIITGNISDGGGGGIFNNGAATLNNTIVSGNAAYGGGGVSGSWGTLTLNNSTVSGNTAIEHGGGITIGSSGHLILNNSTVSDNLAGGMGGGINSYQSTVGLYNATVSRNGGRDRGGGIWAFEGSLTLQNSILAGNTAETGPDCAGTTIGSAGYNLVGSTSGCTFSAGAGDLTGVDPRLGEPLGSPPYLPLLPGSPGIDAGNPDGCAGSTGPLATDQRTAPRAGRCDIGAYEYRLPGPAAAVQTYGGTPQSAPPGAVFRKPLRAAVVDSIGSPIGGIPLTFAAPTSGPSATFGAGETVVTVVTEETGIATSPPLTANGLLGPYTVVAALGGLRADFPLANRTWYVAPGGSDAAGCLAAGQPCATINGVLSRPDFYPGDTVWVATGTYTDAGAEVVLVKSDVVLRGGWDAAFAAQSGLSTVDGEQARRGITIEDDLAVDIDHFAIQNGTHPSSGGGIRSGGSLTLSNCAIRSNLGAPGGGVYNTGPLTLDSCTVTDNIGGGVYAGAALTVDGSTFSRNGGDSGGAIYAAGPLVVRASTFRDNGAGNGGGIYKAGDTAYVSDSDFAGNSVGGTGGAIYNNGSALTVRNASFTGNDANVCGALASYPGSSGTGRATLTNVTISNNTANGHGGGVCNSAPLWLNNVTLAGNTTRYSDGGGVYGSEAPVTMRDSILSGNSAATGGPNCTGAVTSAGYNLVGDTSGCTFTPSTGDKVGLDALLGPPEGAAAYRPLLPGSPALNAGNPAGCADDQGNPLPADQRGMPRFRRCDIGAYESAAPGLLVPEGEPLSRLARRPASLHPRLAQPRPDRCCRRPRGRHAAFAVALRRRPPSGHGRRGKLRGRVDKLERDHRGRH